MAATGCTAVYKIILVIINFFYLLVGAGILSVGIWLKVISTIDVQIYRDYHPFYCGIFILMGGGAAIVLFAIFGCFSAFSELKWMLMTYFCLVLLLTLAEIGGGVYFYIKIDSMNDKMKKVVLDRLQKKYSINSNTTYKIDRLQSDLQCCGIYGPSDWEDSTYNKKPLIDSTMTTQTTYYRVPSSCCNFNDLDNCTKLISVSSEKFPTSIYGKGCGSKFDTLFDDYLNSLIGLSSSVLFLEIIQMTLAMIFYCKLRKVEYKSILDESVAESF